MRASRLPLASPRDLAQLAVFAVGWSTAVVLPARLDERLVDGLAWAYARLNPRALDILRRTMLDLLGDALPAEALDDVPRRHFVMRFETFWGRIRALRRHGWRPTTEVVGVDRLLGCLEAGRGAILWRMSLCGTTVVKSALAERGIPLVHLSSETHGAPSTTWLGLKVVAPLYSRAENRHLAARIVIPANGSLGYLRTLEDHLRRNACVSIMGEYVGRQNVTTPFFRREARFAIGAPSLAWRTGAALLPVYAVRLGPRHYRVVVERPIDADRALGRKAFAEQAVADFSARLQQRIAAHPADWEWRAARGAVVAGSP